MTSGQGTAPRPRPQRATAAGRGSEVSTHRHPNGSDGARPKYVLLAPDEPAGDPASTELQEHGDGHEANMEKQGQDVRETEKGNRNGQRALLACGQP